MSKARSYNATAPANRLRPSQGTTRSTMITGAPVDDGQKKRRTSQAQRRRVSQKINRKREPEYCRHFF